MDTTRIEYLGLDRVLKRGTGEILAERDGALLIRDSVSEACLLACEDVSPGLAVLDRHLPPDCRLLMVPHPELGDIAFARYGFSEKLECYQLAYYGEPPVPDTGLTVRPAGPDDLPALVSCYHLISPEEMAEVVARQTLLLGYDRGRRVGFIGEHLEGSIGLLYVFPEFRRRGYASALERILIARTMAQGFVPFGQVEKDNRESLLLQKKLGMTRSEGLIRWMWK